MERRPRQIPASDSVHGREQVQPVASRRPADAVLALQGTVGNRVVGRLVSGARSALQREARVRRRQLQRTNYHMDVSGLEFGETYHIALAMIVAKLSGDRVVAPRWLTETSAKEGQTAANLAQKRFLGKVYRVLNEQDVREIEEIGQEDPSSTFLSHNVASGHVGQMIANAEMWANTEPLAKFAGQSTVSKAMAYLRFIFLAAPDLETSAPALAEQVKPGGTILANKAAIEQQIRTDLDQLFGIPPGADAVAVRRARRRYVLFNRQQEGSEERNLTGDLVECVEDDAAKENVTQFLVNTSAKDATKFPRQFDGERFINIGPLVQGKQAPNGIDTRTYQLNMMNMLHKEYGVVRIVGMKSGAMDGPAMIGIPTTYFDTYKTGRLTSITPYLKLKRVDISSLTTKPETGPSIRQTDKLKTEWKAAVLAQLAQARA